MTDHSQKIPQSFEITYYDQTITYRLEKTMKVGQGIMGRYTSQKGNGRIKKARGITSYQLADMLAEAQNIQY